MRRKSFEGMECPIARSLEKVGERWSILMLRDAWSDITASALSKPASRLRRTC